jgi:hypothetical protein
MKAENDFTEPYKGMVVPEEERDSEGGPGCLFFLVLLIGLLTPIFFGVDSLWLNNRFAITVFLRADCDFVVPKGYEIVTNGKLYCVKKKGGVFREEYISGLGKNEFRTSPAFISEPSYAFSECKAKAYLKKYLKSINPLKDFKPADFKESSWIEIPIGPPIYKKTNTFVLYNGSRLMYNGNYVIL